MSADLTAWDPVLKQHYSKKRIFSLSDAKNPFFAVVEKNPKAGGKYIVQPVDYEDPQGGSSTIAYAISNTGASKFEDFLIYRKKNYQVAEIDNETIEASKSDENAFIPALKEIDRAFRRCGRRYGIQIFRSGGGYIGRLESGTTLSGAVANLDDHADVMNFQVGMKVAFSDTNGTSGSLRHSGAVLTVTDIDVEGGTVTFGANLNTVTGVADTDYMFVQGDFGATIQGLADWIPSTAPSATAFCGVDRTARSDALGGLRRTCSGEPLLESFIKGTATCAKHGASPNIGPLNPETLSNLLLECEGKVTIERTQVKGNRTSIGFDAIDVTVGGHKVTLLPDVNCPSNRAYLLQKDTWTFYSAGPAPMFLQRSGLLMQAATADTYQVRTGGYANLGCSAPGYNMVLVLS